MTPEFQAQYAEQHKAAKASGDLEWDTDTEHFEEYLEASALTEHDRELLLIRMKMHNKVGNNEDYLGNGVTKDLNPNSPNRYGAVETLNFERKETDIKALQENNALLIVDEVLKPI